MGDVLQIDAFGRARPVGWSFSSKIYPLVATPQHSVADPPPPQSSSIPAHGLPTPLVGNTGGSTALTVFDNKRSVTNDFIFNIVYL